MDSARLRLAARGGAGGTIERVSAAACGDPLAALAPPCPLDL